MVEPATNGEMGEEESPELANFLGLDSFDILTEMESQTKVSQAVRQSFFEVRRSMESADTESDGTRCEAVTNQLSGLRSNTDPTRTNAKPPQPSPRLKQLRFNSNLTGSFLPSVMGKNGNDSKSVFRKQYMSLKGLQNAVTDVTQPLLLVTTKRDEGHRLSVLPYNALCLETRDLFRLIEGLVQKASNRSLTSSDISTFYEWFEGFYGIVTSIFEVMEDVLFSWLEKIGALSMERSLAPKRRSTMATRTNDICWDILELKEQLQKHASQSGSTVKSAKRPTLEDLVFEVESEVEHLAMRILSYAATIRSQIPPLMAANFGLGGEGDLMETAMYRNLKASKAGKFTLAAFVRGMESPNERFGFLYDIFVADVDEKKKKNAGLRVYKKFFQMHVNLADQLALTETNILHVSPDHDYGADGSPGTSEELF